MLDKIITIYARKHTRACIQLILLIATNLQMMAENDADYSKTFINAIIIIMGKIMFTIILISISLTNTRTNVAHSRNYKCVCVWLCAYTCVYIYGNSFKTRAMRKRFPFYTQTHRFFIYFLS